MAVPYRCPVCGGRGHVNAGFYGPASGTNPEPCRSCRGTGFVLVGPEVRSPYKDWKVTCGERGFNATAE